MFIIVLQKIVAILTNCILFDIIRDNKKSQEGFMDITTSINSIVSSLNGYLYSYILIFVLLGTGVYFTITSNFIQFDFKNASKAFKEGISSSDSKDRKLSPFEAFAVTTASRVGTGNLAGVAIAITVGGPGAIFWMWITALLGGALAFAESTLAQIYKVRDTGTDKTNTHYTGGPSYYITQGLNSKFLGSVFALILVLVFGFSFNAVQANTISQAFNNSFNIPTYINAIVLAGLTAIFIFKGLPSIAKATALIVPVMAILYLALCLFVIGANIQRLPEVFNMIFANAFGLREFGVGTLTGTIITGVQRGLFSNEAGMGSAPNAAATASTSHPVKQGFIQACGVFFDTIIICSSTGFLILFSGIDFANSGASGITLTQEALSSYFGSFGGIFLSICIFLLAFSSVLGNYFYAQNSMLFLSKNPILMLVFRFMVIASVFLGSISSFSLVWNIADLLMGIMALINLYALIRLSRHVREAMLDFKAQIAQNKDPVFKKTSITGIENVECWD